VTHLNSPVISSLLGPNIYSAQRPVLSLCSSLNERAHVSHPYKQTESYSSVYLNLHAPSRKEGSHWTLSEVPENTVDRAHHRRYNRLQSSGTSNRGMLSALEFSVSVILTC
jgi:hypothetical protein